MKIGILSDTHDHVPRVKQAVDKFIAAGVARVLHAGDICSPFVFMVFREARMPFTAVFGNNDGEWLFLYKLAKDLGEMKKGPIGFELDGKRLALMHEPAFLDALADSGHLDLIVYGHTHELQQRRRANALILNPGEAGGHLKGRATAMIVDLDTMSVEVLELT
jgi:uncharacterized protein